MKNDALALSSIEYLKQKYYYLKDNSRRMNTYLGLRLYVAFYLTVGVVIGTLGGLFAGRTSGMISLVIWASFTFVALVVALKGVIVLIDEFASGTE